MSDFVNRIDDILNNKRDTRANMCTNIGIPKNSVINWASRGTIPSGDICLKVANYLNTSIEYLLTGNNDSPVDKENRELKQRLDSIKELSNYGK